MPHDVVIIGGGRWGRVHLSVLASGHLPVRNITVVAKHNAGEIRQAIERLNSDIPITLAGDIPATPQVGIVANAAHDHFETTRMLLESGAHVLVEKPVTLNVADALALQLLADTQKRVLFPGLNFRFASYLRHFAGIIKNKELMQVDIQWTDAVGEHRCGVLKQSDTSISVAQDVMPHIWSLLNVLFPNRSFTVASANGNMRRADCTIVSDHLTGNAQLERASDQRRRIITIRSAKECWILDFSTEPGTIITPQGTESGDAGWEQNPKPLTRQYQHFFECIEHGSVSSEDSAAFLQSVMFSEQAHHFLKEAP